MIAYAFIPKRNNRRRKYSEPEYSARYKLPWMLKTVQVCLHTTDKRVAEQKLGELIREAEREHAGIIAPRAIRDRAARSVSEHLAAFTADLTACGRSRKYIRNVRMWVSHLAGACHWEVIADITADTFIQWRARQDKAPKTLNEYFGAINAMLNWLERTGHILANPLRAVRPVRTAGRERRIRRALTDDEISRLLGSSIKHKPVYLTAILTGLRRGELQSLRWGDVHLDRAPPCLMVRASTTKNREPATIFLRDDVAAELRRIRPDPCPPGRQVFHRMIPRMPEFVADLKLAGIQDRDALGRRVDFHSLRHTLCTALGRVGVAPRTAMAVMRHGDMRLTNQNYTDTSQLPLLEAQNRLPRWGAFDAGGAPAEGVEIVSQTGGISGQLEAFPGTIEGRTADRKAAASPAEIGPKLHISVVDCRAEKNSAGRIRTYNRSVNSRLLYH